MILLDTHSVLWAISDSGLFGPNARERLLGSEPVVSSSISAVEVAIKTMLGKLRAPTELWSVARDSGIVELDFTHADAAALPALAELARHDPFDRMIAAQAFNRGATLLTSDRVLLGVPSLVTIDALS